MKKCPLPVLIVAITLMIAGIVGFLYHLKEFADPDQKLYVTILVELLRIVAFASGLLLLRANNLGRWLAISWVLLHVVISAFNSVGEMIMHIAVLLIVCILLFLPVSSNYFNKKN